LSTKMGIMVKGGIFKCFGSAQHIKNKFGTGFIIEIKIREAKDTELWALVQKHFGVENSYVFEKTTQFEARIIEAIKTRISGQKTSELYRQIYCLVNLYSCIHELTKTFEEVELLEQYGNYMRLRVQRLDKSIGQIFGLIEQLKQRFDVESYSVSQTTLEQIFQSFADLQFNEKVTKFKSQTIEIDPENKQ